MLPLRLGPPEPPGAPQPALSNWCQAPACRQSARPSRSCPPRRFRRQQFGHRCKVRRPGAARASSAAARPAPACCARARGRPACSTQAPHRADSKNESNASRRCSARPPGAGLARCACCPTGTDGHTQTHRPPSRGRSARSRRGTGGSSASGSCSSPRASRRRVRPVAAQSRASNRPPAQWWIFENTAAQFPPDRQRSQ